MTRLFHVSDVHFGREDREAIDWFNRKVAEEQPDAIIMTGDLTMQARAAEFAAAAKWLEGLGRPVTVEVFPLRVEEELDDWPEKGQREKRWFAASEAASLVHERQLQTLIRAFATES